MSKPIFLITLAIITVVVLASMLPNRFYAENDRTFMVATVVTGLATLVALALFFGAV
jgi:hypothetical protein